MIFTAQFSGVAITNASGTQDLFELTAAATSRIRILEIEVGQTSELADAQMEIIPLQLIRGYTTSGSGGASVTPVNLNSYQRAAVTAVERNNTTLATTGTAETIFSLPWHLQAGFIWRPGQDPSGLMENRRYPLIEASQRVVLRMAAAVADDLTGAMGTITFEELGIGVAPS